ncbi:MAG: acyl-CoA dehydratase activase-related protein [Bacillota bacterium]|nr:acyl-CoA dehydratase activase-related protein [Bacillota bacterium]
MKRQIRVGIPRALSYYTFFPMWKVFLEKLGAEVIVSKQTNRRILEAGIKETVNDACIPIKVFHGHVFDLADKVDYLFIPRMVSADGKVTFCPKFLGLPDMVRYAEVPIPEIIDIRYNLKGFPGGLLRFFFAVAKSIKVRNPIKIICAAVSALVVHKRYTRLMNEGLKPVEALEVVFGSRQRESYHRSGRSEKWLGGKRIAVALLGYPYAVFDPYISAGVYEKLVKLEVDVVTFEQIPNKQMRHYSKVLPQNFFWYYSNQVCWAGLYLLENKGIVDGIIHVTAFGCGPDAMVDKTLELEAKHAGLPFLSLTIDEHTGEGGVQTRLEAFVDMLWTKQARHRAG